jgi:uncharacterized protein (TIGR03084 family)
VSRLGEVLADLRAEGDQLEALLTPLGEPGWRTATPAAGWDVAHQVAHLAWTDRCARAAAGTVSGDADPDEWQHVVEQALADPDGFVDTAADAGSRAAGAEILSGWRTGRDRLAGVLGRLPDGARIPWFGPPMSATSMATARFMETWAHARDVADALGTVLPREDRVRHVVHLGVRTRDFAFRNRGLEPPAEEFRVALTLPGGTVVEHGPQDARQTVTGSAYDFALVVTQRLDPAAADLTVTGEDATAWLSIAQAFAGPPGTGRPVDA